MCGGTASVPDVVQERREFDGLDVGRRHANPFGECPREQLDTPCVARGALCLGLDGAGEGGDRAGCRRRRSPARAVVRRRLRASAPRPFPP
jgi:hypothetical protein